jgi:hypothetical protein
VVASDKDYAMVNLAIGCSHSTDQPVEAGMGQSSHFQVCCSQVGLVQLIDVQEGKFALSGGEVGALSLGR